MTEPVAASSSSPVGAKVSGWLKTAVGTVAGLLSGAMVMWVSPVLDKVVKPARPVANFAVDQQGTEIILYNRSFGGGDGWWDFGDGSPLEPFSSKIETVKHTYATPGTYVAKLTLRNLLGEESERTVNLQVGEPRATPPEIVGLEATPISPGAYAPATFRLVSKSKNTRLCVWDFGDDRPMAINTESPNHQDQLVTFAKPGGYMVKMVAVNGIEHREKNTVVFVDEPPPGTVTAVLNVTDQATRVEQVQTPIPVTVTFPPTTKEDVYTFDEPIPAKAGYEIVSARFEPISDRGAEGLDLKIADDHHSAHLTGKLTRESRLFHRSGASPSLLVRVTLTQENRAPATRPTVPVTIAMPVPGSATLPLPALPDNWLNADRQLRLEMRDGDRVVFRESALPRKAALQVRDRRCTLTATSFGNQVRIELAEVRPDPPPSGN